MRLIAQLLGANNVVITTCAEKDRLSNYRNVQRIDRQGAWAPGAEWARMAVERIGRPSFQS